MPKDVEMTFSKRTGRIRTVSHEGKLLCTLRIDGGLAISPYFAQIFKKVKIQRKLCRDKQRCCTICSEKEDQYFASMLYGVEKNVEFLLILLYYLKIK